MEKKRILAVDHGEKRIGISKTDTQQLFVQPVGTTSEEGFFSYVNKVEAEDGIEEIVVGYPLSYDGSKNRSTTRVDQFIDKIKRVFPSILIVRWNEYGTTRKADAFLKQRGVSRRKRREQGRLDVAVASIMLDNYLDDPLKENRTKAE